MAKTVLVRMDVTELAHVVNYEMYDEFIDLREWLGGHSNIGDLSQDEVDRVVNTCIEANNEQAYGVDVNVELGRHPVTDQRTYRLCSTRTTDCTSADLALEDFIHLI